MKFHQSWVLSTVAALLLAACGGGGGGDAADGHIATAYAVNAAMGRLLTEAGSWTMSGTGSDGQSYTVKLDAAPVAAATFPIDGAMAARSAQTWAIQRAGVPFESGMRTIYFNNSDLSIVGLAYGNTCSVATSNTPLPTSAAVGASGPFFNLSDLSVCVSGASVTGTSTQSWSLEADAGIVLLCLNWVGKNVAGGARGTESDCVEIAPDGTTGTKARVTVSVNGFTLAARNF